MKRPAKRKLTHPADGIYCFSAKRARELAACSSHLRVWVARNGEAEVPITLLEMDTQERSEGFASAVMWCACEMLRLDLITDDEYMDFDDHWAYADTQKGQAVAFMDLLYTRAKREGRAPE